MTRIRCYETTGRPVFITVVLHRRIPYLKNLVGQVGPQALPDAYDFMKSDAIFKKYLTAEHAEIAENI